MDDLKTTISLLIENAPAMREAGIKRAQFGDVIVDLEPHFKEAPLPETEPEDERSQNPFDDANTFGEGGGYMPGFSRLHGRGEK